VQTMELGPEAKLRSYWFFLRAMMSLSYALMQRYDLHSKPVIEGCGIVILRAIFFLLFGLPV